MSSRKDITTAIKRRDSISIRKMAQRAQKEETRMFLNLLADIVERDLRAMKKSLSQKRAARLRACNKTLLRLPSES
jgi:hypothetical protein